MTPPTSATASVTPLEVPDEVSYVFLAMGATAGILAEYASRLYKPLALITGLPGIAFVMVDGTLELSVNMVVSSDDAVRSKSALMSATGMAFGILGGLATGTLVGLASGTLAAPVSPIVTGLGSAVVAKVFSDWGESVGAQVWDAIYLGHVPSGDPEYVAIKLLLGEEGATATAELVDGALGHILPGNHTSNFFSNPKALEWQTSFNQAQSVAARRLTDPLVLDLNGDGSIDTVSTTATTTTTSVYFDHAADGFAENTGWAGSADGLLVRDLNGNGTIDSGRELFGDQTLLANGVLATNGFTALAGLDSNLNGKVDATDAGFSELRVWQDANSDGLTDAGELHTLAELGIVSLNTGYTSPNTNLGNGNVLAQAGTYLKEDGTIGNSGSLLFGRNSTDSIATEWLTVPAAVQALPNLAGFGVVYDLHQAMARNSHRATA